MSKSKHFIFILVVLFLISFQLKASQILIENERVSVVYDPAQLIKNDYYLGSFAMDPPELIGDQIILKPSLWAFINHQTYFDSPQLDSSNYQPFQSFSAILDVRPKPGYQINSYHITAYGSDQYGNVSNQGSALFSSTDLPTLTISASVSVGSDYSNSYYVPAGFLDVPIYEDRPIMNQIGLEPIYDDYGNLIGEKPIYEIIGYEQVLIGYNQVEQFRLVYEINQNFDSLHTVKIDMQTSSVPLPPSILLVLTGIVMIWVLAGKLKVNEQ